MNRFVLAAALLSPAVAVATPRTYATVKTFDRPQVSGARLSYDTLGIRLNGSAEAHGGQAQELMVTVPESHQGLRLAHIELIHSQNLGEKTHAWSGSKDQHDETAGYSQVEVQIDGKTWSNLGQPKKFAEARQEVERLHDLPDAHGKITAVRVRNVGVDPVHVHGLALHFLPSKPKVFDEGIFTAGTNFGDPWAGRSPDVARVREVQVLGGTRYPGGLTLNNTGDWATTSAETLAKAQAKGWTVEKDSVVIPLQAGKRLRTAEVAIGDTHPDSAQNKDGSYGYKGFAKLDIAIERRDGSTVNLTSRENIPPQGVLVGSADQRIQPGDRLRVRVTADTAGLMGVRIGYDD